MGMSSFPNKSVQEPFLFLMINEERRERKFVSTYLFIGLIFLWLLSIFFLMCVCGCALYLS